MKRKFLIAPVVSAVLFVLSAFPNPVSGGEEQLLETLKSSADPAERCEACRQLLSSGTARAIPALVSALKEERVGHAALSTLERMPFPEAGEALRRAVGTVSGPVRVGVIDALGRRKDAGAPPSLTPLLDDPDASVAGAAAVSLGRIGGPDAVAALTKVSGQKDAGVRLAIQEALLRCAEQYQAEGRNGEAAEIYRHLYGGEIPRQVRSAALNGLLMSDGSRRRELFTEAVGDSDPRIRGVAMQVPLGDDGKELYAALVERWPSLPPDVKTALLEKQSQLGEKAMSMMPSAAKDEEESVRMTALRVMGEMGQPSMIPLLSRAAAGGDKEEQLTARRSLARIHGPGVNEALIAHLGEAPAGERVELLRILGERGDRDCAEVLLRYARSDEEAEKEASLHALYLLADPKTVAPLEELARGAGSEAERKKLERIVDEIRRAGASQ